MKETVAYALVQLKECNEQQLVQKLIQLPEVNEAHIVFGEWDLIVKIKADNPEKVGAFVMEHIRKLPEVELSSTMIVAR
jgi:anthranilate phosphoribosyltransferase